MKRLNRVKQNMLLTKGRLKPTKNDGLIKHKSPKGNMVIAIEMQKCQKRRQSSFVGKS